MRDPKPVAEILDQAEREGWPTSYIDAMANHHLCGTPTQDYVNKWFTEEPRCPTPPQQS